MGVSGDRAAQRRLGGVASAVASASLARAEGRGRTAPRVKSGRARRPSPRRPPPGRDLRGAGMLLPRSSRSRRREGRAPQRAGRPRARRRRRRPPPGRGRGCPGVRRALSLARGIGPESEVALEGRAPCPLRSSPIERRIPLLSRLATDGARLPRWSQARLRFVCHSYSVRHAAAVLLHATRRNDRSTRDRIQQNYPLHSRGSACVTGSRQGARGRPWSSLPFHRNVARRDPFPRVLCAASSRTANGDVSRRGSVPEAPKSHRR
jgi:hypothetical protein